MFRFFENLVDPYSPYEDDVDPPAELMQYLVYRPKLEAHSRLVGVLSVLQFLRAHQPSPPLPT